MKKRSKWDHVWETGSKDWGKFRGKVLADLEKEFIFVVLKGLSGEEMRISGNYETVLRKLLELCEVIDKVVGEVEDIVQLENPEAHKRVLEWMNRREKNSKA